MEGWLACGPGALVLERHFVDYPAFRLLKLWGTRAWAFSPGCLGLCLSQPLPTSDGITVYT